MFVVGKMIPNWIHDCISNVQLMGKGSPPLQFWCCQCENETSKQKKTYEMDTERTFGRTKWLPWALELLQVWQQKWHLMLLATYTSRSCIRT